MSKRAPKRHNCIILLRILFCQILIAVFFVMGFGASKPPAPEQCVSADIAVEDKAIVSIPGIRRANDYKCLIHHAGQEYYFDGGATGKYSYREFYQAVEVGDHLKIVYVNKTGIWGNYSLIIDARNDKEVYMDMDTYLEGQQTSFVIFCVIFAVIEILFIGISTALFILFRKKRKAS